jgi:CheY-like chemotaxis protein
MKDHGDAARPNPATLGRAGPADGRSLNVRPDASVDPGASVAPVPKRVLIADDELPFLHNLKTSLEATLRVEVVLAHDGEEAIRLVDQLQFDLIVTDLQMPNVDGFAVLTHLSRRHPRLPVLVMTAFANPELAMRVRALGVTSILEKPLDLDMVVERVSSSLREGASGKGFVRGLPIASLLQLMELEHKTCFVTAYWGDSAGEIQFTNGVLHYARTPRAVGESAISEILSWVEPSLEIENTVRVAEINISSSLSFVLLDSLRAQDELSRGPMLGALLQKVAKEMLGEALLEFEVVHASLEPKQLGRLARRLLEALSCAGESDPFPAPPRYCLVDFDRSQRLLVVPTACGHVVLRIDASKTTVGLLLSGLVPALQAP